MRVQALIAVLLALLVVAVAAPVATAADPAAASLAVLGVDFPSVKSIVEDVVKFFFGAFLDALVPDWLKDGSVALLKRLVMVPNPTNERVWPTLAKLADAMRWIAIPLLSLAAVAAWTQQWINELTGRPASFEAALTRTALAAILLVSYAFFLGDAVALINTLTNAMLSVPAVEQGLERTVGLVFAGTLLSGSGLLLALLGIAAVVLGVGLFMLSVGLLILFGILFVSAPLAIVCSVVDETHGVWTAWRYTLLTAALVPIGWCVLFATAGAFVLDMTRWSGGIAGELGTRLTGVFAALIILYLAVRWPLMLWSAIRMQIGGALMTVGARRNVAIGGRPAVGGQAARAALQRTSLRVSDSVAQALGAARGTVAGSARMALRSGFVAAGVSNAAPTAQGAGTPMPSATGAQPVSSRVRSAAAAARSRARAAADAGRRSLGDGSSAGAALDAAAGAATRPRDAPDGGGSRRASAGASGRRSENSIEERGRRRSSRGRGQPIRPTASEPRGTSRAGGRAAASSDGVDPESVMRNSRKRRAEAAPSSSRPATKSAGPGRSHRSANPDRDAPSTAEPRNGAGRPAPGSTPASRAGSSSRALRRSSPGTSSPRPSQPRISPSTTPPHRAPRRSPPPPPRTPPRPALVRPAGPPRRPDRTRKKR